MWRLLTLPLEGVSRTLRECYLRETSIPTNEENYSKMRETFGAEGGEILATVAEATIAAGRKR